MFQVSCAPFIRGHYLFYHISYVSNLLLESFYEAIIILIIIHRGGNGKVKVIWTTKAVVDCEKF